MPWKKAVMAVVVILLALLIVCARKNPFASWRYHGDGQLSDNGFFSYPPRYKIVFGDIPLDRPNEKQFRVSGLPIDRMQLVLAPQGTQLREWAETRPHELKDLMVEATLKDDTGSVACHVVAHPATPHPYDGIWNLVPIGESHIATDCGYTHVDVHKAYTLVIRVVDAGASYHDTSIAPILQGGGLDIL